jgi:threonine/homoserine/homoserine lactone efflux protein
MERRPFTAKGIFLGVLTVIVIVVFGTSALFGQEKIAFLFTGYLKYFWMAVLVVIGVVSSKLR